MSRPRCPALAWKIGRLAWSSRFWHHTFDARMARGTLFCLDGTFEHIGLGFMWQAAAPEVPHG